MDQMSHGEQLAVSCSATSPHYPTRRPDIGSSVTLVDEQQEAIVVAIEQKYWPEEWVYLIRIEDKGQLPKILYTILHRNGLKSRRQPLPHQAHCIATG